MEPKIISWFNQSKKWVFDAGNIIRQKLKEEITINTKSNPNDLVTNIDREIESFFKQQITQIQDHRLLGEEGDFVHDTQGYIWILDPIDGTTNLVTTKQDFAISLALYHNGAPLFGLIYDVMRDELYHAITGQGAFLNDQKIQAIDPTLQLNEHIIICDFKEIIAYPRVAELIKLSRGHRRYGSAALEIVHVATGQAGAFIHMMLHPWDIAAAKIIAEACGLKYSHTDGTSVNVFEKGSSLVAPPNLHQEIVKICFS
ncbi:inositol monophosphatase family protein [Orbaceae bacterium ESL0727]|nr:inositol monophosphatase family protein [Orbaceae bacterium ESL0727]